MKRNFIALGLCFCIMAVLHSQLFAQASLLQSGPMLGTSAMREVKVWMQTTEAAQVHIEYWEKGLPQTRKKSERLLTQHNDAFTALFNIALLEPGKRYQYEVFINNKKVERPYLLEFQTQVLWRYRTDPPNFSFAFGSCFYVNDTPYDRPGRPYGDGYQILKSIYDKKPDFMLWGGDNIYLREGDYDSRSGIFYRNTHTRSLPELQPLLGGMHHYAIWDDHDFGPNDADGSYVLKNEALEAFKKFWANPSYGVNTDGKGIYGSFIWADAEFFLLDNRYFRTANENHVQARSILGAEQYNWLINALTASSATFKFIVIGGQVLNTAQVFENYSTYPEEREKLLSDIRKSGVKGVIFLSGDRHHTELSILKESDKVYPIYDLTCSPITSGAGGSQTEPNTLRVPGTMVNERNFAQLEISGKKDARKLKINICNTKGEVLWNREIEASQIQ